MAKTNKKNKRNKNHDGSGLNVKLSAGVKAPDAVTEEGIVTVDAEHGIDLRIPEESENLADKELALIATDSVRSYYTFINLAALIIVSLGIALTFIFIREGERYGVDNTQLSVKTFLDGSYTASIGEKYINDMKLSTFVEKLSNITQYAYGFGTDMPITPVIPDPLGQPGDYQQEATTTTWYTDWTTTTSGVTETAVVSVNDAFTGTPVTMPSVTIEVESDFTGILKHTTTTMTTSFTTTKPYSPTATTPKTTSTTTAPNTTSQTVPSDSSETTPVPSETDTPPSETTEPAETPTVTTTPPAAEPGADDNL